MQMQTPTAPAPCRTHPPMTVCLMGSCEAYGCEWIFVRCGANHAEDVGTSVAIRQDEGRLRRRTRRKDFGRNTPISHSNNMIAAPESVYSGLAWTWIRSSPSNSFLLVVHYDMVWGGTRPRPTSPTDESRVRNHKKNKLLPNTTTMVVTPPTPTAAWIY
jgi:hypothetical protein